MKEFGSVDILVNNAAALGEIIPFEKTTLKEQNNELVTLIGTFNCTRAILASMIERQIGRIINISSIAGRHGMLGRAVYSASNGGIDLFRGEEIFTDIYDDPKFVHHLMELSTRAYIEVTKVLKEAVEEDLTKGYHGQMYMGNGGVRVCEDTTTLLSHSLVKEFVIPYTKKALEPFGGGWIHYCGNGNHMLDLFLELEDVKGVNFGNPEMHNYDQVMEKLLDRGKFYYGSWSKNNGEDVREYFNRILKPLKGTRKSLIFTPCGGKEEDWHNPDNVIALWHSLQ